MATPRPRCVTAIYDDLHSQPAARQKILTNAAPSWYPPSEKPLPGFFIIRNAENIFDRPPSALHLAQIHRGPRLPMALAAHPAGVWRRPVPRAKKELGLIF